MQKWFELLSRTVGNMLLAKGAYDVYARIDLCNILNELGALAKPSTYLLLEAFRKEPDADVRMYISRALGSIGNPEALYLLQEAALSETEDFFVRRESVRAIANIAVNSRIAGVDLDSALETLMLIVEDYEIDLGDEAAVLLPSLLRVYNNTDVARRTLARLTKVLRNVPKEWRYTGFVAAFCKAVSEIAPMVDSEDSDTILILKEIADPYGFWPDPACIEASKALAKLGANDQQLV